MKPLNVHSTLAFRRSSWCVHFDYIPAQLRLVPRTPTSINDLMWATLQNDRWTMTLSQGPKGPMHLLSVQRNVCFSITYMSGGSDFYCDSRAASQRTGKPRERRVKSHSICQGVPPVLTIVGYQDPKYQNRQYGDRFV